MKSSSSSFYFWLLQMVMLIVMVVVKVMVGLFVPMGSRGVLMGRLYWPDFFQALKIGERVGYFGDRFNF